MNFKPIKSLCRIQLISNDQVNRKPEHDFHNLVTFSAHYGVILLECTLLQSRRIIFTHLLITPHHQILQSLSDITNLHETTAHFPINWTFCLSFWVIRSTVHQTDGNINSDNTATSLSTSQFAHKSFKRRLSKATRRCHNHRDGPY